MKKFPVYNQHDANDCGATCLRMIASYFGKYYFLETLREMSHISKLGVSMLGLSEAAEEIGLRTIGARLSFDRLAEAPLPCIVYWNQNHFVVVYKINKKKNNTYVHIADPAVGRVKFTKEEFCSGWINTVRDGKEEGMVLLISTTPAFFLKRDEKKKKNTFSSLFSYLVPYKKLIIQLIVGLLFGSLLQLVFPFLTQAIVDVGIRNQNIDFIYLVLLAQLMLILSSASIEFVRGWILLHIGSRVNIALISSFLMKLMKLPIGYFDSKMTGDLLQRIGDHNRIQDFLTNSSLNILFSIFNVIVFGAVLCWYSIDVFIIFLLGSLLYFMWVWLFMKKRAELDHKNFSLQSANQSNIVQLIMGMQEIRLNACERQKRWEWENIQAKLFNLRIKGLALGQYQDSGAILINQTKNVFITFLVAKLVVEGQMTLGMMLSIQYIIGQLNGPIDMLIVFLRHTQDAKLSLNRLNEINDKEDEESQDNRKIQEIPEYQDIYIDNVSFAYNKTAIGQNVLDSISFKILANKRTAIVGMSGSGKTTLLKLLLGFYPVEEGNIYLGDSNLDAYSWRKWRKRCGVVMQESYIFSDTIARNIAPGVEGINKEKLLNAVNIANIREFIESLPLSYNTIIGSEGHALSQGQKQRILIARAVYKEPEFVFFDEATNALDAKNERVIMNNLNSFFCGKTVVIVAHRLSTVRNAEQILVLEKGKIVETGNHAELIENKGVYFKLVKDQLEL